MLVATFYRVVSFLAVGILEEIRHYSADILCLQEVEQEQFNDFFKVEFEKDGYEGVFSPKSRFQTMPADQSRRVDGCAIFWRVHKYVYLDSSNPTMYIGVVVIKLGTW